jgi:hypothetical protein
VGATGEVSDGEGGDGLALEADPASDGDARFEAGAGLVDAPPVEHAPSRSVKAITRTSHPGRVRLMATSPGTHIRASS